MAGLHPILKWSLTAATCVTTLAVVVPALVWIQSEAVIERRYPVPSTTATSSTELKIIHRGAHLVAVAGCTDCHGQDLEGRLLYRRKILAVWSSNLRLLAHRQTDEEFERVIRTGIKPDSTSTWIMPAMDYEYMSEDDVAAIISYLRAQTAAGAEKPQTEFDLPSRLAIARGDIEPIATETLESPASLDLGHRYDGGRYLARIACGDCHGTDLTGGDSAPDLAAVGRYSRTEFFALLHAGRGHDGRQLRVMSRSRFRAFYDYEVDALYDYLSARATLLERSGIGR